MNPRQKRFVEEYRIDLNASAAAIRSGYSKKTSTRTGHRLLRNPSVRREIELAAAERSQRTDITADMVLTELYYLVSARLDFFEIDENGNITTKAGISPRYIGAVASMKKRRTVNFDGTERESSTTFALFDKTRAVSLGLRHLGLLNDKLQISGEESARKMIADAAAAYDREMARLASRLATTEKERKN